MGPKLACCGNQTENDSLSKTKKEKTMSKVSRIIKILPENESGKKTILVNLENTLVHYSLLMSSEESWPPEYTLRFVVNNRTY